MLVRDGDPVGWETTVRICQDVDALRDFPLIFTDEGLERKVALRTRLLGEPSPAVETLRQYLPQQSQ